MMRHWKTTHDRIVGSDSQRLVCRGHAVADSFMTKHHPLACAGGARSESDESDIQPVVVRRRFWYYAAEITARCQRYVFSQRLVAENRLQLHCRGNIGQFLPGAFGWDRDNHGIDSPESEREHDVVDAVGTEQSHATPGCQTN